MSVDVWLIVFGTIVAGQTDYRDRLADASRNGYSMDGSLPGGFGDESTVFQKRSRGEIVYEILWRDRNCVVIFYMAAATPPPPEFSMTSAITIATAQEKPIAANLASY